jgi:hypothetical protein
VILATGNDHSFGEFVLLGDMWAFAISNIAGCHRLAVLPGFRPKCRCLFGRRLHRSRQRVDKPMAERAQQAEVEHRCVSNALVERIQMMDVQQGAGFYGGSVDPLSRIETAIVANERARRGSLADKAVGSGPGRLGS